MSRKCRNSSTVSNPRLRISYSGWWLGWALYSLLRGCYKWLRREKRWIILLWVSNKSKWVLDHKMVNPLTDNNSSLNSTNFIPRKELQLRMLLFYLEVIAVNPKEIKSLLLEIKHQEGKLSNRLQWMGLKAEANKRKEWNSQDLHKTIGTLQHLICKRCSS